MTAQTPFRLEERAFLSFCMPTLGGASARNFLDSGKWVTEEAGHFLTLEGEDVGRLIYLVSGTAEVTLRLRPIGVCGAGSFIGEISFLDGGPATASIMLLEKSRYFTIASTVLQKLCAIDPELRSGLERALAEDTRKKLVQANKSPYK